MSHKFEKRGEARQSEIRAGSVLAHVTKRIAAITPPRALVVLRFLLNTTKETHCFLPNPITLYYLTNYIRSAETCEIFGLVLRLINTAMYVGAPLGVEQSAPATVSPEGLSSPAQRRNSPYTVPFSGHP